MITFKKLQQGKVMITQLHVYQTIHFSKKNYKLIATDLSKKQKLGAQKQCN